MKMWRLKDMHADQAWCVPNLGFTLRTLSLKIGAFDVYNLTLYRCLGSGFCLLTCWMGF